MFKKKIGLTVLSLSTVLLLSACGDDISKINALSMEEITNKRVSEMTQSEKEGAIYKAVADRITVDKAKLLKVQESDFTKIKNLISKINKDLSKGTDEYLKQEYVNYLLNNFTQTPYKWKQSEIVPVGYDASSKLYFVDVTYKTKDTMKMVVPKTKVPNGNPEGDALKKKRYEDYVMYLTALNNNAENSGQLLKDFKKVWGDPDKIRQEQQGESLMVRTNKIAKNDKDIGNLTYSGVIKNPNFTSGGTMTVRYVLKYKYNLGEETDLDIHSLYIKNYELDNKEAILEKFKSDNEGLVGTEVLKPFIDKLILSYNKATEESNDVGLFQLFKDYADVDKYYNDLYLYSYMNTSGYKFEVLNRQGTTVNVLVSAVEHKRSKGANTSMPTYDTEYIMTLKLDADDKIKVDSINTLSSKLVGEPISVIKDVSGVSDLIQYSGDSFTKTNKAEVEKVVKKFSKVVFNGDTNTKDFASLIDTGISDTNISKITKQITSLQDNKRGATYIVSWNTKTNIFVSLTLREVFETGTEGFLDTEATIDLINRDGVWKVSNYTRTLNIKTNDSQINEKNAIAVNE